MRNILTSLMDFFTTIFLDHKAPFVAYGMAGLIGLQVNLKTSDTITIEHIKLYTIITVCWILLIMVVNHYNLKIAKLSESVLELDTTLKLKEAEIKEREWDIKNGIRPFVKKGGVFARFIFRDTWNDILEDITKKEKLVHAAQLYTWHKKLHDKDCYRYTVNYETGYISELTEQNAIAQSIYYLTTNDDDSMTSILKSIDQVIEINTQAEQANSRGESDIEKYMLSAKGHVSNLRSSYDALTSELVEELKTLTPDKITDNHAIRYHLLNLARSAVAPYDGTLKDDSDFYTGVDFDDPTERDNLKSISQHLLSRKRTGILSAIFTGNTTFFSYFNNGMKKGRIYISIPIEHKSLHKNHLIHLTIPSKEIKNIELLGLKEFSRHLGIRVRKMVEERLDS